MRAKRYEFGIKVHQEKREHYRKLKKWNEDDYPDSSRIKSLDKNIEKSKTRIKEDKKRLMICRNHMELMLKGSSSKEHESEQSESESSSEE